MDISVSVIVSWVFVAILTGVNIFVFLKLKGASEQMMKAAFPGAKNMNDAVAQMQKMVNQRSHQRFHPGVRRGKGKGAAAQDAQLKQAMDMLGQMQGAKKR